MGGHIVEPLHRVVVVGFALAHQAVHDFAHIGTHIGVGIFIDREGARGVLHKEMEQPYLGQGLRQVRHHFACDKVTSATLGR